MNQEYHDKKAIAARDAAITAKDTEIASLRTRLDSTNSLANARADRVEELLQTCRQKNFAISALEEQRDKLLHSNVHEELRTTHAAHKLAVQKWSDAEAEVKSLNHRIKDYVAVCGFWKKKNTALEESLATARVTSNNVHYPEVLRLKKRVNELLLAHEKAEVNLRAIVNLRPEL